MARTYHHKIKFRGYSRERAWAKKLTMRKWKAVVRHLMRQGRYDDLPPKKGTQGWITW